MLLPFSSRPPARRPLAQRRQWFRPRLELLEDRSLLSAGALDLAFGQYGVVTADQNATAVAVAVEGDGKIVLLDQTQTGYDVLRFNTDGSLDTTFGNQGVITGSFGTGTSVINLAVLSNDQIVVGGDHTAGQQTFLDVARFNSDGSADTTFGTGGLAEFTPGSGADSSTEYLPTDMAVQGDGDVVVAGTFGSAIAVVRLNTDGSLDTSFGSSGMATTTLGAGAQVGGLALQGDGKIVVTGADGNQLDVVRFNTDGSQDSTFGNGGIVTATLSGTTYEDSHVAIDASTGQVVVAVDSFTDATSYDSWTCSTDYFKLYCFNSDGSTDSGFGTAGQIDTSNWGYGCTTTPPIHSALEIQNDGKILVASNQWGESLVTRYNVNGTVDLTYGIGGTTYVSYNWENGATSTSLALQGDGKVVVAGTNSEWVNGVVQTHAILTRLQADSGLAPAQFGSEDAFRQYLLYQAIQQYSRWFNTPYYPYYYYWDAPVIAYAAQGASLAASAATSDGLGYSQTNTQVAGVAEGDTVKTDGHYLYILSNGNLVIVNASPASNLATLSVTPLLGSPLVEYLNGNRLTVISSTYGEDGIPYERDLGTVPGGWWYFDYWSHPEVTITVYDVSDPAAPTVVQQTTLDGSYSSSRAIGNTVYVAVNNNLLTLPPPSYAWDGAGFVYESEAQYIAQMESLALEPLLPQYSTTWTDASGTHVTSGPLNMAADIYQPAVPGDNNLVSLVAIDAGDTDPASLQSVSFLTSYNQTLYAATDNFYLITSRWSYSGEWTFIDKISLQNGGISLAATGRVPGDILNQFAVGEDGAYLDIATTTGWGQNATNSLFVLAQDNQTLDVVGQLDNLSPGESITAIQFMGDRAFVSTYAERDPLFAIDLGNPTNPVIAGKLSVPGYTSYLLPIDATHLIGIGEVQNPASEWNGELAISLYDVLDLNNPILLSSYVVSTNEFTYSQGAYDYHAITYFAQDNALALPVYGYGNVLTPYGSQWVSQSGLLVLHVDPSSGAMNLLGEISDVSEINRSVFIGNMVYAISYNSVQVESLDNLSTPVAQVQLPPPAYPYWWWGWEIWDYPITIAVPLTVTFVAEVLPTTNTTTTNTTTTDTSGGEQGSAKPLSHPASKSEAGTAHKTADAAIEHLAGNRLADVPSDTSRLAAVVIASPNAIPPAVTATPENTRSSVAADARGASLAGATTPSPRTQESQVNLTGATGRQRHSVAELDDSDRTGIKPMDEVDWVSSTLGDGA